MALEPVVASDYGYIKDVDRAEYNAFVQMVQSEAPSFGFELRLRSDTTEDGVIKAEFAVYYDGWHILAQERNAMTPECLRCIFPKNWEIIKSIAVMDI